MGYEVAMKKDKIVPLRMIWMDLEAIMLSEMSAIEKDKYQMISVIWNLKNKWENKNQYQTHKCREQTNDCQR